MLTLYNNKKKIVQTFDLSQGTKRDWKVQNEFREQESSPFFAINKNRDVSTYKDVFSLFFGFSIF